jgi:hypothetical protein
MRSTSIHMWGEVTCNSTTQSHTRAPPGIMGVRGSACYSEVSWRNHIQQFGSASLKISLHEYILAVPNFTACILYDCSISAWIEHIMCENKQLWLKFSNILPPSIFRSPYFPFPSFFFRYLFQIEFLKMCKICQEKFVVNAIAKTLMWKHLYLINGCYMLLAIIQKSIRLCYFHKRIGM